MRGPLCDVRSLESHTMVYHFRDCEEHVQCRACPGMGYAKKQWIRKVRHFATDACARVETAAFLSCPWSGVHAWKATLRVP